MEKNKYQDINDDIDSRRFENDSDYPWDESYIMNNSEIDAIKRNLISDKAYETRPYAGASRYQE